MNESPTFAVCRAHFELRFTGLFKRGRGYAFPCDAGGHVVLDEMSDKVRSNYFYARAMIGKELSVPVVSIVA